MSWLSKAGRGGRVSELQDLRGQITAIGKSSAVIEFELDGTIITANENFLKTVGYTLEEVKGKHHSMFADPVYARSPEYRQFWDKLGRGEFDSGRYKRIAKGGKEIWIQASYNAILDRGGRPFKVVKFATDITEQKMRDLDVEGQLAAINKAQAVIEFTLEGKVLHANQNFLNALGYTLEEIRGQHHSMFVDPAYRQSAEYRQFWEKLGRGEFDANQYQRFGKGGKEIWIQASYNPILDANGKPFKVVKYATDVTATVKAVQQTREVVAAVKENDMTQRIPLEGKSGDIAQLCEGVNGLLDTMTDILVDIKTAASEVNNASSEISASTTDLSQRTEEQASSLEETSAAMEEMSATVKKNAENAQQANQFANETAAVADRGGAVVSQAVTAMSKIEEFVAQDLRHHQCHRRDRAPDQSPGAQRRSRGGARGRGRTRLCGGGFRSAQPGAAFLAGGKGHQGPDHQQFEPGAGGRATGQQNRHLAHRDRGIDQEGCADRRRHCGGQQRAGNRHRPDQHRAQPDGRGHATELRAGRGECRDGQDARAAIGRHERSRRRLQGSRRGIGCRSAAAGGAGRSAGRREGARQASAGSRAPQRFRRPDSRRAGAG